MNTFCMTFIFSLKVYGGHKKHSSRKSSEKNADIFKITNILSDRRNFTGQVSTRNFLVIVEDYKVTLANNSISAVL